MPILVDERRPGTSGTAVLSLAWQHRVGVGNNRILLVFCGHASTSNFSVSGVVWGDGEASPQSLTRLVRVNDSVAQGWAEIWYLLAPKSGTHAIKVTYSGSTNIAITGSASYSGVDQATPFNAAGPHTAIGTAPTQPSVTVTTAVDELAVDGVTDNETGADTLVVGGGQTTIFNTTVGSNAAVAASDKPAVGASVAMAWSGVSGTAKWSYVAASLRPFVPVPFPAPEIFLYPGEA